MLLYLLTKDPRGQPGSFQVGGVYWKLAAQDFNASDANDVSFTCVSYTWGTGREHSPFNPSFEISDRTISALSAVVADRPSCTRFWVDAFCVPFDQPEKTRTLESMGYIYSRADEVVVVLSDAATPVLEQMSASDHLEPVHLETLEKEEWISRAWTYQEVVNSRTFSITCDGLHGAIIPGNHFLNCLGHTLSGLDSSGLTNSKRQQYPRLDAFEDLIADYMIAGYGERSALQVMSNMERRNQELPEDHFFAMIGAISSVPASASERLDPCEAFMSLCERKGDYSFIYSSAKRDSSSAKRWRPVSGDLPSILPWHCFGDGQTAHEVSESLYLDQMLLHQIAPIDEDGKKSVEHWLSINKARTVGSSKPLHESINSALRVMGFKGSSECLCTASGFFFPSERILNDREITILIATGIRWSFGAPGLARFSNGSEELYMPGVFFGRVDSTASTSIKVS
jgi:hypothetical protein